MPFDELCVLMTVFVLVPVSLSMSCMFCGGADEGREQFLRYAYFEDGLVHGFNLLEFLGPHDGAT